MNRRTGHDCSPPDAHRVTRWKCECGRRWIAVYVVLLGYRWYRQGQVRFP